MSKPVDVRTSELIYSFAAMFVLGLLAGWGLFSNGGWLQGFLTSDDAPEWVQAIGSVGAIVAAIVVWARQAEQTRQTQRQSLMPKLVISGLRNPFDKPNIAIILENKGLGPAIFSGVRLRLDDHFVNGSTKVILESIAAQFHEIATDEEPLFWFHGPLLNDWISSGDRITLVSLTFDSEQIALKILGHSNRNAQKVFDRLQIEIDYRSVFGEEFVAKSSFNV